MRITIVIKHKYTDGYFFIKEIGVAIFSLQIAYQVFKVTYIILRNYKQWAPKFL